MKKYRDPVNYKLSKEDVDPVIFAEFMNGLTDVPESVPLHNVTIDEAGITEQQHIFFTQDFAKNQVAEPLFAEIEMSVSLEGSRGIHMSRCEEVLFEFKDRTDLTLVELAEFMAIRLREVQGAEKSYVTLSAQKSLEKTTNITNNVTYDKIFLYAKAIASSAGVHRDIGITAFNMTACPCTKTHTKFSIIPDLINMGIDLDLAQRIVDTTMSGTHTQRGTIAIKINDAKQSLAVESLYDVLDKSTHLVNELLKRPDEHDLVCRALARPQFTEDVVREVAVNLKSDLFEEVERSSLVTIESILQDSIHIHNVKTVIRRNFSDL